MFSKECEYHKSAAGKAIARKAGLVSRSKKYWCENFFGPNFFYF